MTTQYRVTWQIDIEANSPREAAEMARAIQRKPDNIAGVFDVAIPSHEPVRIDLDATEDDCDCNARSWYGSEHDSVCPLAGLPRV